MKAGTIDDLIGDTYARIYEQIVPSLVAKADEAENRDRMRIDRMLMNSDTPAPDATSADQPTVTTRPKAIGRTEVRRRAEALVSKLTAPATHWRGKAVVAAPSTSRDVPTISSKKSMLAVHGGSKDALSSVPGSVHDGDADDESESELSEIEADEDMESEREPEPEKEKQRLFPGLVPKPQVGKPSEEGDAKGDETADDVSMIDTTVAPDTDVSVLVEK